MRFAVCVGLVVRTHKNWLNDDDSTSDGRTIDSMHTKLEFKFGMTLDIGGAMELRHISMFG
jgi:hypothetical protein